MPAAPILYPTNHFDGATITVTGEAAGFSRERLRDRFIGPPWKDSATTSPRDIISDRGAGGASQTIDTAIIAAHNLAGVTINLDSSPDAAAYTSRDSWALPDANAYRRVVAGSPYTFRAWRWRMLSPPNAPSIPELFLTKALPYPRPPLLTGERPARQANVIDHESVAGVVLSAQQGPNRWAATWTMRGFLDADKAAFEQAFDDLAGGAKPCWLLDENGVLRWAQWLDRRLEWASYTIGSATMKWEAVHRWQEVLP